MTAITDNGGYHATAYCCFEYMAYCQAEGAFCCMSSARHNAQLSGKAAVVVQTTFNRSQGANGELCMQE